MSARVHVAIRPFDLGRTFALRFGIYDVTTRAAATSLHKALATSRGTCILHIEAAPDGVVVTANGAEAEAIARELAVGLVIDDGHEAFAPQHPLLSRLHRAHSGMRLVRVPWRFDIACGVVLEQRVTVREAWQQRRRIAQRYGDAAGEGLYAFPTAERIAQMDSWRIEELGVDPKRARAVITLAREIVRRSVLDWTDVARVRKHLMSIRGIGPWTTEMTLGYAYGDPDALPLADLHLPHLVTWALAREPRGTDARMQELLAPFAGHRFRAVRLLLAAGIRVPVTRRNVP